MTSTPPTVTDKPTRDERIEAARKEAEELRKIRWQNEQDEINQMAEGAERRRRQIALDYEKQLAEIDKMRSGFVAVNEEAGTPGLNLAGLTDEQQTEIDRANSIAVESRSRALQEMYPHGGAAYGRLPQGIRHIPTTPLGHRGRIRP